MAISFSLILLMAALFTTTTTPLCLISAAETNPPSLSMKSPPISTAQTSPPATAQIQEHQLNNIVDALIGARAGDFAGWANLLSSAGPLSLPLTATLFIPSNEAISAVPSSATSETKFSPFLIPYHIVPQRLTFADLQQFRTYTRLPTLLPAKYIVITNNSRSNFTIDDSQIVQADILVNAAFSVHGITKVLDYSVYGGSSVLPSTPPEEKVNGQSSGPSFSCIWILMIFWIFCAVSAIKNS